MHPPVIPVKDTDAVNDVKGHISVKGVSVSDGKRSGVDCAADQKQDNPDPPLYFNLAQIGDTKEDKELKISTAEINKLLRCGCFAEITSNAVHKMSQAGYRDKSECKAYVNVKMLMPVVYIDSGT